MLLHEGMSRADIATLEYRGCTMKIRKWLIVGLFLTTVALSFASCAEEEEYRPDYYVIVDVKDNIYHDPSCNEITSGHILTKKEYNSAAKSSAEACDWCEPNHIYEYGSYIQRDYSLSEKLQDIIQGDYWEVFPDCKDFDNVDFGTVFGYFCGLILCPIGALFVLIEVFCIAFLTVCITAIRLAVVCIACSPIILLVWWIRKKRKERRGY